MAQLQLKVGAQVVWLLCWHLSGSGVFSGLIDAERRDQTRKGPADTGDARVGDARPDRRTRTLLSTLITTQPSVPGPVNANKAKVEIV